MPAAEVDGGRRCGWWPANVPARDLALWEGGIAGRHGRIIGPSRSRRGAGTTAALSVLGLAVVEIWGAVPVGLALGLSPYLVWALTVAGSMVGVAAVAVAGEALRAWLIRRRGASTTAGNGRLYRVWVRYGVVGWGLVSPLVFAPAMGTAIGIALGAPRRRLILWMGAGVVAWTSILVIVGDLGLRAIHVLS